MLKQLLTTVAAAALIGTAGLASAQNTDMKGGAQMKSESPAATKSDAPSMNRGGDEKGAPAGRAQARPEGDMKAKGAAETKSSDAPARANAQAKPDADGKAKSSAETKDSNAPARTNAQSTTTTKSATETNSTSSSKTSVSLSTEQRTKIRTTVLKQSNAPRVAKVDFNISIGTRVPRTVRAVVLPTTVVEVYPQWRGFLYFIVGDEIVVVEPDTMEIVAVLAA